MDQTSSSVRGGANPASERAVIISVVQGGIVEPLPTALVDAPSGRYFDAFELLESASKALEFLESRRGHLETALVDVSKRAEEAVAVSADRAADWQRFAADLKARNADLERQVQALSRRAEIAEGQCAKQRDRAEAAEYRAAEAQKLLRGLHGKVLSAFGKGTRAYDILSVAAETASKVPAMPKAG